MTDLNPPSTSSAFTACFILVAGGPDADRILIEICCYIDSRAAVNPLSRGPILAIDIPRHDVPISDALYAGELAQMVRKLPCGVILEWLVPRHDAPRAFGLYVDWDEMAGHPDLVDIERATSDPATNLEAGDAQ